MYVCLDPFYQMGQGKNSKYFCIALHNIYYDCHKLYYDNQTIKDVHGCTELINQVARSFHAMQHIEAIDFEVRKNIKNDSLLHAQEVLTHMMKVTILNGLRHTVLGAI